MDAALLIDAFLYKNPSDPNYTRAHIYKDQDGNNQISYSRIDHVFVHKTLGTYVRDITCISVAGTDHRGLKMTLQVPGSVPTPERNLRVGRDLCQDPIFQRNIEEFYRGNKAGTPLPECFLKSYLYLYSQYKDLPRRIRCPCPSKCNTILINDLFWWLELKEGFLSIARDRQRDLNRLKKAETGDIYEDIKMLELLEKQNPHLGPEIQPQISTLKKKVLVIFKKRAEDLKKTSHKRRIIWGRFTNLNFFQNKR